jgi:TonB family protein
VKTTLAATLIVVCCFTAYGSATDPSNFFYRVSPANLPLKLEPVYYAPRPDYPLPAQKQHLEGIGLMEIHIKSNGSVESVRVLKTTGHGMDQAAIRSFGRWRFRPHSVRVVRMPVQYRMTYGFVRWGSRSDLKDIGDGDGVVIVAGKL